MRNRHCASIAVLFVGASLLMPAQVVKGAPVISPNAYASVESDFNNGFPFDLSGSPASMRYQQVYDASQFSTMTSAQLINRIAFRLDGHFGNNFTRTLSSIQIDLSTTPQFSDGLSATFASNVGADNVTVFPQGPLSLSSNFMGPFIGPRPFDVVINLTTPFLYDPSKGNLLLDVRNFGGGFTTTFDAAIDSHDGSARVFSTTNDGVAAASGTRDTTALITQFSFVPEPSSLALAAFGLASLALYGWRKRRPQNA